MNEVDLAIVDFSRVTSLKPDLSVGYHSLGESWLHLKVCEKARLDLTVALAMGSMSWTRFVMIERDRNLFKPLNED